MRSSPTAAAATQWCVAGVVVAVLALQLLFTAQRVYTICSHPTVQPPLENTTATVPSPRGTSR